MLNATEVELLEATKSFEEYMRLIWEIVETRIRDEHEY